MWGLCAFLGCLSVRADQCGCVWKSAAREDQDPALVLDLLCPCSRFSQVSTSEGLCRIICVCICPSLCLSVTLYVWAGGSALRQCIMCRSEEVTENPIQPTKQAAQCQLLLTVLGIILTLFSYCLTSLSKPQPDLHPGGQVKSNSDRIYTNDFFRVP